MIFVTIQDINSYNKFYQKALHTSLRNKGSELRVITTYDPKIGNLSKIVKTCDFLNSNTLNPEDIMVFCDAHDVIMHSGEVCQLEDTFKNSETDYIISCENWSSHHLPEIAEWFVNTHGDHHINSGFQIGYVWAFAKIYNYICDNLHTFKNVKRSDQMILSQFFVRQKTEDIIPTLKIDIDTESIFCKTINSHTPLLFDYPSFFIHVTWLRNIVQANKFDKLCDHHNYEINKKTILGSRNIITRKRVFR